MSFEQGPYLQVAAFCEKVLTEQDGVLSLIRVVDRVTQTAVGPDASSTMQPFDYSVKLVLSIKSGKARGRHDLRIERQSPSGEKESNVFVSSVHLEGENRGNNTVIEMVTTFQMEGVYWFSIYLSDELLTKLPFEVRYARLTGQVSSP